MAGGAGAPLSIVADRAYSIEAIARELGTSLGTVSWRAKYLGLTGRRPKIQPVALV